ncbi:transposase [Duganella sp. BJB1802]|uniref:transposase n=1 Tax=Duganella sp. BJB1802 TaxID=2744575 RepID=UPI001E3BE7D3|nr:transposase [Duganella sp. BJB1802]
MDTAFALKDIRQQEREPPEALAIGGMDEVVQQRRQHITWLSAEIEKLESDIDDHIDRHPGLKHDAELLTTIPGVGMTTAAKVLGVWAISAALAVKAFAAFLGVTPKQRSSGSSVRGRTTISRTGNTSLRAALYMPSLVARRHNPILRQFAERLALAWHRKP